jgi:hypothetical protein
VLERKIKDRMKIEETIEIDVWVFLMALGAKKGYSYSYLHFYYAYPYLYRAYFPSQQKGLSVITRQANKQSRKRRHPS